MKYEPVIGLEVHVELATESKMFCTCSADYFGKEPNTHTCSICLGLPGAMPSPNQRAIECVQKLGLALNCESVLSSKFDRKNYFYPDLAKGFQISQYDLPFSKNGFLHIKSGDKQKKIGITRAHMEEDTGKLTHAQVNGKRVSLIDFNRSGVPLIEIVSEPEMNSAEEAKQYAQKLQQIVRYLKISDADMEEGSMRIEPNVSLKKPSGKGLPSYKVELKNINSFKFAQNAINYEIERQSEILDRGEIPKQETRGWNEAKNVTYSQRSKEEAHDYRYFPEPDLPPFVFEKAQIQKLKSQLIESPDEKFERFVKNYELSYYDTEILTRDLEIANFFEEAVKAGREVDVNSKQLANYIINKKPDTTKILPATLIKNIVSAKTQSTLSDEEMRKLIKEVISENQKIVADYRAGNKNAIQALVGQAMAKTKGKLDAGAARATLEQFLG